MEAQSWRRSAPRESSSTSGPSSRKSFQHDSESAAGPSRPTSLKRGGTLDSTDRISSKKVKTIPTVPVHICKDHESRVSRLRNGLCLVALTLTCLWIS